MKWLGCSARIAGRDGSGSAIADTPKATIMSMRPAPATVKGAKVDGREAEGVAGGLLAGLADWIRP